MPLTEEDARQRAQELVHHIGEQWPMESDASYGARRDEFISDVAAALIEASKIRVVTKERPPFVFNDD